MLFFSIGLDAEEENKNIIEMLRSKVRDKLKNAKVMLVFFFPDFKFND